MASDTDLEKRIDKISDSWGVPIIKKKMFSGVGYMLQGNLAFGTHKKDSLIVRSGEDQAADILKKPGIGIFDMTGRPMKNWFIAGPATLNKDSDLESLLKHGRDFALSLPPK